MIIDFCGGDGTGKTTAFNYFCERLESVGKRVLRTREVGNPHVPVCVELRELILDPNRDIDGRAMELIFSAMRIENARYYAAVADDYDFIVSDRGWLCHLSYTKGNVDEQFVDDLYVSLIEQHTFLPDRAYLFHVDHDVAESRRSGRDKATDVIEAKGSDFQRLVASAYLEYAEAYRNDFQIILVNTGGTIDDVRRLMDTEIEKLLNG